MPKRMETEHDPAGVCSIRPALSGALRSRAGPTTDDVFAFWEHLAQSTGMNRIVTEAKA